MPTQYDPLIAKDLNLKPTSFTSFAVGASAIPLTALPIGVEIARIDIDTAAVRARWDGSDPTTSVGVLLAVGDTLELSTPAEILNLKLIADTGSNGRAQVHYYTTSRQ